ncbi:MAG: SurA N-terminal domain-containing protein [Sphaerochaetaceae bacterium]
MPSNENDTTDKIDNTVVKFKAPKEKPEGTSKKKHKITLAQIATYVILGLLAVVMTFGVFPSFGNSGSSSTDIVFGSYDKTPITFAYGNYFYRQYQNQAKQATDSSQSAAYQIWRSAFENTVFYTAVKQLADKAGIIVAEETLNQAIIDSGVYNKDGKFDTETYTNATVEYQNQVKTEYTETLPVQTVMQDMSTILSVPAEVDYIIAMGNETRTFDYVVFNSSNYPDELAATYASANPALFTQLDSSIITMADETAANTLREEIVSGSKTFSDAATADSIDSYAADGGRAGMWYLYELQEKFTNTEEVNVLFSTAAGGISKVFASPSGFIFFKVEAAPRLADFTDKDVLSDVKTYIAAKDATVLSEYLNGQATAFIASAEASGDFASSAKNAGVDVASVSATPANIGQSSYLSSFSYTDGAGSLASLSSDTEAMKKLYTQAVNTVAGPFILDNSVLVAKITSEEISAEDSNSYLRTIYPYISQSQNQQDLIQSVFSSDKLVDNFFTVFLEKILGITASKS